MVIQMMDLYKLVIHLYNKLVYLDNIKNFFILS